jgi:hypothetical protein
VTRIVCWFGFAGWIITWVFIPDTTGLDLREQDRYWNYVREGRAHEYHGIAVHPRHLSMWERFVHKRHLAYDPEQDREDRVKELREMWMQQKMVVKEGGKQEEAEEDEDSVLNSAVSSFFASESSVSIVTGSR